MDKKTMADITYLGRGVVRITIGSPPKKLREMAVQRGYKSPLKNSSFSKVVKHLEWEDELAWLIDNRSHFQKDNLKILKENLKSIERAVKKDLPVSPRFRQKIQQTTA